MTKLVHKTQRCNKNKTWVGFVRKKDQHVPSEALNATELGFHVKVRGLVAKS